MNPSAKIVFYCHESLIVCLDMAQVVFSKDFVPCTFLLFFRGLNEGLNTFFYLVQALIPTCVSLCCVVSPAGLLSLFVQMMTFD